MATTVNIRYIVCNQADNPQAMVQTLTALTVDNSVIAQSPCYVYDNNGNLVNNSSIYIFAYLATNDAAFKAAVLSGSAGFSTPIKTWAHTGVALN